MGVNLDGEAEVRWEIATDLLPALARVVASHDVPVLLHEQHLGSGAVQRDAVHAVADFRGGIRHELRSEAAIHRPPGLAAIVSPEHAGSGDGDEHALGVARIRQDGVQAHAARAWLPRRPGAVAAQPGQLLPVLAAIGGSKQRCVLYARVDGVRIGRRWLETPDARELPRARRSVVPQMRARLALVGELVANRLPGPATVIRALDLLPEPATGLRGVEPIGVGRRALDVIDLPACEVRATNFPLGALAIRGQDESPLARPYQYPYAAHSLTPV